MGKSASSRQHQAFVMVELAVAMLVIAVGVLALFAIFRTSSESLTRGEGDMRAALFAQEVMGGLRATADSKLENVTNDTWATFWEDMRDGWTNIPVACSGPTGIWSDSSLQVTTATVCTTLVFTNRPLHSAYSPTNIVSHSLRYMLSVEITNSPGMTSNRASATLYVWEGAFGSTNIEDARVFYTEFGKLGEIPSL